MNDDKQNSGNIDFTELILKACMEYSEVGSNDFDEFKSKIDRLLEIHKVTVLCSVFPQCAEEGTSDREQWLYWSAKLNLVTDSCVDNCNRKYQIGSPQWQLCVLACG